MSKKHHNQEKLPFPDPLSFGLPPAGVETHAHLDDPRFNQDREKILDRAKQVGLARIGQVFLGSGAWSAGKDLFREHPEVFFILGVHPTEAQLLTEAEIADIEKAVLEDGRIKALGEIGLDYYWKNIPPETQKKAFKKQIRLAREMKLPVVVHCREAVDDALKILIEEGCKNYPVLWHCFGADSSLALRLLDLGWHISIPGPVTFPSNLALREAVKRIPPERLVMETDCPYLAPLPHRGERNEPAYLAFTIQAMAEARNIEPAELWSSCGRTAAAFFRLE
ncbi:MAG: TatD family hydrolase [Deltaproteobacteria bacterium]|jgi:TatD DNase family protein|nr:TatD family hydrolase [Deltaproteobacteria bacterium]